MPTYSQAVESLYALGAELAAKPRRKFDLEHMRRLVDALGHPERKFPSILIAGTNGKGSTAADLASILTASGLKTALYTSPHLIRVNERIRINGNLISDLEFANLYGEVQTVAEGLVASGALAAMPSFFEVVTAMAFCHFAKEKVDIAVLEVGLGGRLDATNVTEPIVSIITDIDFDHQQWLGNTLTEIAHEKAGIMRKDRPVILLPQHPEVNRALGEHALSVGARAVNASSFLPDTSPTSRAMGEYSLPWEGATVRVNSPLRGRHQWRNLALALACARELKAHHGFQGITAEAMERGIHDVRWPGRFQRIRKDGREYILDVAHNPAGAWSLRSALRDVQAGPATVVFGAMADKDIREIATVLFPIADCVVLTRAATPRAAEPEALAQAAEHTGAEFLISRDIPHALEIARERCRGPVVVTGSVYVVGEALAELAPETAG
ncbi:MAG: bifunctional folylpolyglutamate synthase/dihydrofolate synthase [Acidobacteriales bacterium]|nr:bifunctional folylpolyglutamate synthase/dihydrofolate synthase [Terriglobales bacterium]